MNAGGMNKRVFMHSCAFCAAGLFTGGVLAREGVDVGNNSAFSKLVPAEDVERSEQARTLDLSAAAG